MSNTEKTPEKVPEQSVASSDRIKFSPTTTRVINACLSCLDWCIGFITNRRVDTSCDVIMYARPPIIFGFYVILIFIVLGGAWASFAPLDSAAHAYGVVVAASDKQRIQHLYGGRVKHIFVKQGDAVNAGQALLELQSPDARASYEIALNNYLDILALQNRLVAQRDSLRSIEFDGLLLRNRSNARVAKLLRVQENIFKQMEQSKRNAQGVFEHEIEKCKQKRAALLVRKASLEIQLQAVSNQFSISQSLENEGLSSHTTSEGILADKSKCEADIAAASLDALSMEKEISCLGIKIKEDKTRRFEEALKELREVQTKLADSREKYALASSILYQQLVVSPMDGIVNDITKNAVISPQGYVGDVTPSCTSLIVEARIPPQYIDSVQVGQISKLRFTAFKSRTSPTFKGKLVSISPNVVIDHSNHPGQGNPAYVATIEVDSEELTRFLAHRKLKLLPGMAADVQIVTGTRTMLRYLLDPVLDQAFKSFKEK